jgi:hypothetical protein
MVATHIPAIHFAVRGLVKHAPSMHMTAKPPDAVG